MINMLLFSIVRAAGFSEFKCRSFILGEKVLKTYIESCFARAPNSPSARWLASTGLALGLLVGMNGAQATPFTDGSFETPGNGNGRTDIGAGIGPWVHGGPGLDLYEFTGNDGQVAQDGDYFLGFGHSGTTGGNLTQTFDTLAGTIYNVSYYTAKQQDGAPADPALFDVSIRDAVSSSLLAAGAGSVLGTLYQKQTLSFTATGSSTALTFQDDGGINNISYNLSVDNFSVVAADVAPPSRIPPPANNVPEPASTMLLASALLSFGFLSHRHITRS